MISWRDYLAGVAAVVIVDGAAGYVTGFHELALLAAIVSFCGLTALKMASRCNG